MAYGSLRPCRRRPSPRAPGTPACPAPPLPPRRNVDGSRRVFVPGSPWRGTEVVPCVPATGGGAYGIVGFGRVLTSLIARGPFRAIPHVMSP
ncbi:hypothetical protein GCM10010121_064970 [Streptomyces brasiliensis]|uniref:Uncharacterized protein n=1 Tax=Streptomyces brasiliensis TaxID=1954 RepID=A0A917L8H1_9ACTN|nr:hypothetical protein GCM10010121_064970 [Streptomyces brasiliensis]